MLQPSGNSPHYSVLWRETLEGLNLKQGKRYIDGTVGAAGHSYGILQATAPDGQLLGLDLDPRALAIAHERLKPFNGRYNLIESNFSRLFEVAELNGFTPVAGVVLDLGLSSMQLDNRERGFSFQGDGPLDMRFGESQGDLTAATIVNEWPESELIRIFFEFGEEPQSKKIAYRLVEARQKDRIETTGQLAGIIEKSTGGKSAGRTRKQIHPATRVFQALRLAVNKELERLTEGLTGAVKALEPGGRLAVISFHSLEDRVVKNFMRNEASDRLVLPGAPTYLYQDKEPVLRLITKKPLIAGLEEQADNRRSRSAKLRIAEKI